MPVKKQGRYEMDGRKVATAFTLVKEAVREYTPEWSERITTVPASTLRRLARELESSRWFERSVDELPAEREAMRNLAELPADQREVIVLKIWHRYTFEEIGALLEVSPNTVAARYRYGLQKMKLRLERTDYERDELAGDAMEFLAAGPAVGRS